MEARNAKLGFDKFRQSFVYIFHLFVVLFHLPRVFIMFQFYRVTFLSIERLKSWFCRRKQQKYLHI